MPTSPRPTPDRQVELPFSALPAIPATPETRARLGVAGVRVSGDETELEAQSLLALAGKGDNDEPPSCYGRYSHEPRLCIGCLFSCGCEIVTNSAAPPPPPPPRRKRRRRA